VRVHFLPKYAPETNPVEEVCRHLERFGPPHLRTNRTSAKLLRTSRPTRASNSPLGELLSFSARECVPRADAIADGVLIYLSATAKEAGFRFPVALTAAAWGERVTVPPGVACQDEGRRLWDVLWMLHCAAGRSDGESEISFAVHVRKDNRERTPPLARLKAICGPGDQGEPVITVMMPDED
jgi:hypothetical protein